MPSDQADYRPPSSYGPDMRAGPLSGPETTWVTQTGRPIGLNKGQALGTTGGSDTEQRFRDTRVSLGGLRVPLAQGGLGTTKL